MDKNLDEKYMVRVIEFVKRGIGGVNFNFFVGVVIVKDGKIIGEGWYKKFGGFYVEVWVLNEVGENVKGVIVYVILEFCFY